MDKTLAILCFLGALLIIPATFPLGPGAVLILFVFSLTAISLIRIFSTNAVFLQRVFLIGLLLRVSFGLIIHILDWRDYFGPDAYGYDAYGARIADVWSGALLSYDDTFSRNSLIMQGAGWGMKYFVAVIYWVVGRNILAAQFACAVVGACIAPLLYHCTYKIFENTRVAKNAALLAAVAPAFVIYTGQLLKDSLVIFLLVLAMLSVMKLLEKHNIKFIGLLLFSLLAMVTLRFYVAYITAVAVMGSFLVGTSVSFQSVMRRVTALVIIVLSLFYLGFIETAEEDINTYANLERIQQSRSYLSTSSESGYAEGQDVSTVSGAISALPIGFVYLMFAPFPWEAANIKQLSTAPEVILWWALIPLMLSGIIYTVRHRLRKAIGVLIFTLLLTISYSLFQGNVGTAYRQRCQIQVFLFIFISVGWTLKQERRKNINY